MPTNKFGDIDVHFESSVTHMTLDAMFSILLPFFVKIAFSACLDLLNTNHFWQNKTFFIFRETSVLYVPDILYIYFCKMVM